MLLTVAAGCDSVRQICDAYGMSAGELTCELVALKSTRKQLLDRVTLEYLDHLDREVCCVFLGSLVWSMH